METGTFSQDSVKDHLMQFFITLKYESGRDAEQFQRFAVKGTPTFIVLDTEGNEADRKTGYLDAKALISWLEEAVKEGNAGHSSQ